MELFGIHISKATTVVKNLSDARAKGKDEGLRHGDKVMAQLLAENAALRKERYGFRVGGRP